MVVDKKTNPHLLTILALILWMMAGCEPTETNKVVRIISAREYFPLLLDQAQLWEDDVYLDYLRIDLSPSPFLMVAHFQSSLKPYESLGVNLLLDGTITTEKYSYDIPLHGHEPISESDWLIDSQDALNMILEEINYSDIDFSQEHGNCLRLERFLATISQPVIWHLVYDFGPSYEHYYLDPITGELLELSRDFFPTRFFTPTP
jgi:hypothetical protein